MWTACLLLMGLLGDQPLYAKILVVIKGFFSGRLFVSLYSGTAWKGDPELAWLGNQGNPRQRSEWLQVLWSGRDNFSRWMDEGLVGFMWSFLFFFSSLHGHYLISAFSQLNLNLRICLNLRFTFDILPSVLTPQILMLVHNTNNEEEN